MGEREIDTDRIDDAVLALLYLGVHDERDFPGVSWSWKTFDWAAMDRLHAKGMISDPVNKAKSVFLSVEGRQRCEELFGARSRTAP